MPAALSLPPLPLSRRPRVTVVSAPQHHGRVVAASFHNVAGYGWPRIPDRAVATAPPWQLPADVGGGPRPLARLWMVGLLAAGPFFQCH